jgi:outer membrane protein assembly factor BamD (BamD/ComL family)
VTKFKEITMNIDEIRDLEYKTRELTAIKEEMHNGNWDTAIKNFKKIKASAREFEDYLDRIDVVALYNFTLLGYYIAKGV